MFSDAYDLPFETGDFFMGYGQSSQNPKKKVIEIGLTTDRHAITIAGSGSGKGTCVIIPNLRRWPHSCIVIDPKGENADATWQTRRDDGQAVHVIDPFDASSTPADVRASFNPLQYIDKESLTAGSDLLVLADGLIKKTDPRHAEWDETAIKILAGVMAYVLSEAPPEHRTINAARNILLQAPDALLADAHRMMANEDFDGIIRDAGNMIVIAADGDRSLEGQALSQAKRQTQWISMRAFRNVLESSTFNLADLRNGKTTVYLVLPPEYLDTHGAFLKLFVQSAIAAMLKGGTNTDTKCLFLLDEFYSLGRMDSIQKGFGILRGYGVQLWPFLQDIGQLITLYGKEGMQTFFANSDLHQFFGVGDQLTVGEISTRFGHIGVDEISMPEAPSAMPSTGVSMGRGVSSLGGFSQDKYMRGTAGVLGGLIGAGEGIIRGGIGAAHQNSIQKYQQEMQIAMANVGKLRLPPDKVMEIVARESDGRAARRAISFVTGGKAFNNSLIPYFVYDEWVKEATAVALSQPKKENPTSEKSNDINFLYFIIGGGMIVIAAYFFL